MGKGSASLYWRTDFSAWRDATVRLRARIDQEVFESSSRVLATAQELAPVRTGELRDSGVIDHPQEMVCFVTFGRGLPDGRAVYQEFGTVHHPPHPYLAPAFMQEEPVFIRRLAITTQGRVATVESGFRGATGMGIQL